MAKPLGLRVWGWGLACGLLSSAVVGALLHGDQSGAADALRVSWFFFGVIFGGFVAGYRQRRAP